MTTDREYIDDPHHPALVPALRWMADLMRLWGLCARPACRRAAACRGEPRDCLARYAPLVPEEARDGVRAMASGQWRGLSFEALCEESEDELEAMSEWQQRVEASARGGGV